MWIGACTGPSAYHFLASQIHHLTTNLNTGFSRVLMTSLEVVACEKLKKIGYSKGKRIRIYGQEFDLISDPVTVHEQVMFVDGIERRSGETRRIRIPLPIVRMMFQEKRAA
jgi:hypothetical protein